jgi:hypothetical protein
MRRLVASLALLLLTWQSHAQPTYASGRINNITFVNDMVLIKLDVPLPGNCAGTGWGWMAIPATNKPIQAFVLALQARGALSTVTVLVYTDPVGGSGYCTVSQIDPTE